MLTRVFSNLCDNALRHTPHGGTITIEAKTVTLPLKDAIPNGVVRRVTRPDIPNAVGKNWEGDFWIIVPT